MLENETKQTTYWLYAVIVLTVVDILAAYSFSDPIIENADLSSFSSFREGIRVVSAIFYFGSFVVVARWIYLAAKVNQDAGTEDLKYSPGATVA